jgi:hypothetical protein
VNTDPFEQLIWDLDETLEAEGYLPLHMFSGWLRGQNRELTEDQIASLCQRAYEDVTRRYSLHLEWFDWPVTDISSGRKAEAGAALDFGSDASRETDSPFLALVPDDVTP